MPSASAYKKAIENAAWLSMVLSALRNISLFWFQLSQNIDKNGGLHSESFSQCWPIPWVTLFYH